MENKKAFGHALAIFTIFIQYNTTVGHTGIARLCLAQQCYRTRTKLAEVGKPPPLQVGEDVTGCVIALIGISIISFSGTTMHLNPIGDILSVGAAMVWSFYAVLSKKMGAFGYSVIQTTRRTFFYGILFMIPALYFFDFKWDLYRFSTLAYIFNIFYLGLGVCDVESGSKNPWSNQDKCIYLPCAGGHSGSIRHRFT